VSKEYVGIHVWKHGDDSPFVVGSGLTITKGDDDASSSSCVTVCGSGCILVVLLLLLLCFLSKEHARKKQTQQQQHPIQNSATVLTQRRFGRINSLLRVVFIIIILSTKV
jgi:hypothetical protein